MRIKSFIAISALTLVLTGCGSEYAPDEISVSSKGTFVERGSDSEISGTFVLEKVTGESLTVEIDDGLPDGDVEMTDEKGNTILRASFKPKDKQNNSGSGFQFINAMLTEAAGNASTNDYLNLFEKFAEYDGDYLEVDRNNQRIEGNYENGEKIGRWKKYCENKQLASDQTFKEFDDGEKKVIKKVGDDLQYTCNGDVVLSAKRDKKSRLQGKYIENHYSAYSLFSKESDEQAPLKPKYAYQYKDGEFDGLQKEYSRDGIIASESNYKGGVLDGVQKKYDRDGKISLENNYKNSVKDGVENVYATGQNYTTKEKFHWLSEVKNYSNGTLHGQYKKLDEKERVLELGTYQNDKPTGQWLISNYKNNTKTIYDFDANNFTLDKQKAFKDACRLPTTGASNLNWAKNRNASTDDCQYYISNGLVDINKKIPLDNYYKPPTAETFERSTKWTYPVIAAKPNIYSLMKQAGAKTNVSDSVGRTRLHHCVSQLRQQNTTNPRCTLDQLKEYAVDTNPNSVSNIGTVFHQMALKHGHLPKSQRKSVLTLEKEALTILINSGANLNQTNHAGKTPFMAAMANGNLYFAENAIDAGASVKGVDVDGKSVLGHFFITSRNRLKTSALNDDSMRILAKAIALGIDTQAPILNGKTIKELSEEHNTLFHLKSIKDATAMSNNFKEALSNRPQISETDVVSTTPQINVPAVNTDAPSATAPISDTAQVSNEVVDAPEVDTTQIANTKDALNQSVETAQSNIQQPSEPETTSNNDVAALLKQQADFLVTQANEHIANYRLKTPKSNSALGSLEQLQKIDPGNENIALIREKIGKQYLSLASGKINKGEKSSAQKSLESAKEFLNDESLIADYQTRINNISTAPVASTSRTASSNSSSQTSNALTCNPTIKIAGIPLIGGQSLTAEQTLPMSVNTALSKAFSALQKDYENIKRSGKKITYEQATQTKPIKFTLTVSKSGSESKVNIKAKTPAGVLIKKSGYQQGFCELLANF